jgi:hypothetical protein
MTLPPMDTLGPYLISRAALLVPIRHGNEVPGRAGAFRMRRRP